VHEAIFVAALDPGGELDWARFVPIDGWVTHTELRGRSDGSFWFGGLVDVFDEAIFTWPDATMETIVGRRAYAARLEPSGDLAELLTFDARWLTSLAVGPDDALIAGGVYWSTVVFAPGEAGETELQANGGAIDEAYVAKWTTAGALAWAISLTDGNGQDAVHALDVDSTGDIVVAGRYGEPTSAAGSSQSSIFGEGDVAVTLQPYGDGDGFVARLDADGQLQWVRRFGGADARDSGTHVRVLADGSIAVAGTYSGPDALFGEDEPEETTLLEQGSTSAFLARYSADGDLQWVRSLGGGDYFGPSDLELTPNGDIAVLFATSQGESATVGIDAHCTWSVPAEAETHVLVYDDAGVLQWTRHDPWNGGIFDSTAGGLAFDGFTGYMSGNFHDATFGLGEPTQAFYETDHNDAAVAAFSY
jgi:hypothetical protein